MDVGEPIQRMTTHEAHHQTRLLVQAAAQACEDKKALDTRILELDPAEAAPSPPPRPRRVFGGGRGKSR